MRLQQVHDQRKIIFDDRVTSGVALEVFTAYNAVPRRGAEAGGILLGSRSGESIRVEDFEPVLCEHRFGPSYFLSEDDFRGLEESVEWFRTPGSGELQVLGFYRSQTRSNSSIDERDHELMRRFFPDSGALFLLLRPDRQQNMTSELYVLAQEVPEAPRQTGENARVTRSKRLEEVEEPAGRNWTWVAAVAALSIAGGILGYRSVTPASGKIPSAISQASSPSALPVSNPTLPVNAVRNDPGEMEREVREAIAQWQEAVLSGDANLIAACYASQADRQSAGRSMTRYGRPAILRISDLTLVPLSETRAVASFRKHWQTGGARVYGGEEQERLTFIKGSDGWKIESEQEIKVYWTQRPRG